MKARQIYFYLAVLNSVLTLALISLGGLVHNTGSSMACPDWPLCFGQVFPKMEGQVAIEHSHRLLATLVGLITIALVALSWSFRREEPRLYKVSWIALGAVVLQGVLGGLTVMLNISPLVSTFHLGLSQIYFGLSLYLLLKSRPSDCLPPQKLLISTKVLSFLTITLVVLYLQILWGAAVRHSGAGAACGLGPAYSVLCMDAVTEGVTLWPDQAPSIFHVLHRYLGMLVAGLVIGATIPVIKWAKSQGLRGVRRLCVLLHIGVLSQILLGVATVWTGIGVAAVTLHLVFAGLLFAGVLTLNVLCRESFRPISTRA